MHFRFLAALVVVGLAGCGGAPKDAGDGSDGAAAQPDATAMIDQADPGCGACPDVADVAPELAAPLLSPIITVTPENLYLGTLELGEEVSAQFKICNVGTAPLVISGLHLGKGLPLKNISWSMPPSFVVPTPTAPGVCDTAVVVKLKVTATVPLTKSDSAVARVEFDTNAPLMQWFAVQIFAQTSGPTIVVTPGGTLDFGSVGSGATAARTVNIFNDGNTSLSIAKLSTSNDSGNLSEFSVVSGEFAPTAGGVTSIPAGQSDSFKVAFTAKGAPGQTVTAKLHIISNDPGNPDFMLPLRADRTDVGVCKITMEPQVLNFGVVAQDEAQTLPATLHNIGSAPCKFKQAAIGNCKGNGLPPPLGPGPTACALGGSTMWSIGAPQFALFSIGPADSAALNVTFTAPPGGTTLGQATPIAGLLNAIFEDLSSGVTVTTAGFAPNDVAAAAKAKPNLAAKLGVSPLEVTPKNIDFGDIKVGCKSMVRSVSLINEYDGTFINSIALVGCGTAVAKVAWPALPKDGLLLAELKTLTFDVVYAPKASGSTACALQIATTVKGACVDPDGKMAGTQQCFYSEECGAQELCVGLLHSVGLAGSATTATQWSDTFEQVAATTDMLFVVHNSLTMGDEQAAFALALQGFLATAAVTANNYHIGVITTDMFNVSEQGGMRMNGSVRVVTPKTENAAAVLTKLTQVGTNGPEKGQGLLTMKAALSLPKSFDSVTKGCKADADCGGGQTFCVPSADSPGELRCGGTNRTFLREGGNLAIVVLSDGDDWSAGSPGFFAEFLVTLKKSFAKSAVRLHAIVGDAKTGCTSPKGDAQPGTGYLEVAQATGGKIASICDASYAGILKDIANAAFGLTNQFALSHSADPATLAVTVNGKPCAKPGYSFDAATNSVVFAATGGCMPKVNEKVVVDYKILCL